MGRPTEYDANKIAEELHAYTEKTKIPILAEFCHKNKYVRQYMYELAEREIAKNENYSLSDAIKDCVSKKEFQLERLSLEGKVNSTQAIFSLKQLGWKDRQEIDSTVKSENTNLNIDYNSLPDAALAEIANAVGEDNIMKIVAKYKK